MHHALQNAFPYINVNHIKKEYTSHVNSDLVPFSCNVKKTHLKDFSPKNDTQGRGETIPILKNINFRSFNNLTPVRRCIGSPPTEVRGKRIPLELWNNANVDLNFVRMLHC